MTALATRAWWRRYGPAAAAFLAVPLLSLLPASLFRRLGPPLPPPPGFDKLAHALMYAGLAAACFHALGAAARRRYGVALRLALLLALYGLLLEFCQRWLTASRGLDPLDALANAAGAAACAALACARARRLDSAVENGVENG